MSVRAQRLIKRYGATEAVRGIDLDVRDGEIFGLIGPDGAGKTSTFHVLAGVMEATSGEVAVFGRAPRDARADIGYLTQTFSLYRDLTVAENIRYAARMRHVPDDEIESRAGRYLALFDLDRFTDRLAGQLSGGMKQKLALVCALVPQPRVLLLDEPTTGVDPVSRRELWNALAHLAADGLTIVVATPYLDEAERCDRVALMHLGEIHQTGSPAEIRASLHASRLELWTSRVAEAEQVLLQADADVQRFGDRIDVLTHDAARSRADVSVRMAAAGIAIDEIRIDEPSLENVFVATLRGLGYESHDSPFPSRHDHTVHNDDVAIDARNLTKQYGDFTAVRDVTLQIRYGEIYGLLGANGAGKTTTIKMLCGLVEPTRGEMLLAGESGSLRSQSVRQRIGYMSQKFSLYDDLTIEENLDFFAGVYGIPDEERAEKRRWVLAFAGLEAEKDKLTGTLPGGWKQRVAFGAAIMHEPDVLFLDEPTSGVDPLARRALWKMMNRLADSGTAILVTTHYLEETEQCNRLGMMVAGALVAEGTPGGMKKSQSGRLVEIVVDQPQRAADLLQHEIERWRVSLFGHRIHVITEGAAADAIAAHRKTLESHGIRVTSAREARFSLEDVFINVVEQSRLEKEAS